MYIIRTTDADSVQWFWSTNSAWTKKLSEAQTYREEYEAQDWLDHLQSIAFGTRTDNAEVANMNPKAETP